VYICMCMFMCLYVYVTVCECMCVNKLTYFDEAFYKRDVITYQFITVYYFDRCT